MLIKLKLNILRTMAKVKFLNQPKPRKESDWFLVAKLWPHKTKKDAMSGRFGVKTKDAKGNLQDVFGSIEISSEDPLMIRPNLNQREGKRDPSHLVYMLKEGAEQTKKGA